MDLLTEFFYQMGFQPLYLTEDCDEMHYQEDFGNYNNVDGEEGDYGIITHSFKGQEIAKEVNYGGDKKTVIFTKFGKEIFAAKAFAIIKENLECEKYFNE